MKERPIRRFGHRAFVQPFWGAASAALGVLSLFRAPNILAVVLLATSAAVAFAYLFGRTDLEAERFVIHIRRGRRRRELVVGDIASVELPEPNGQTHEVVVVTTDGERLGCPYWDTWYWDTSGMTNLERRCRLAGVETARTRPWETR